MISHVHDWLVNHPISQSCIIAAIFGLIFLLWGKYWDELKTAVRQPPQKYSNWRRSTRIQVLRNRIGEVERASNDSHFYIEKLVHNFGFVLMYIVLLILIPGLAYFAGKDELMTPIHQVRPVTPFVHFVFRAGYIFIIVLPLVRISASLLGAMNLSRRVTDYPESVQAMRDKLENLSRQNSQVSPS